MAVSFFARLFSARGKLQGVYERGLAAAKAKKLDEALKDYNTVLGAKNAPNDLRAMTMFNRAVVFAAQQKFDLAQQDLEALLKLDGVPSTVASAAREKLVRVTKRMA